MSVFKRKTSAGKTREYHFKFMSGRKWFYGVCEGCLTKDAAQKYESRVRETASRLAEQKSIKALVENFRYELSGGSPVSLMEAFDMSLQKPRKRKPLDSLVKIKRGYWSDWVAFVVSKYPEAVSLSDIEQKHAEAYISCLQTHGRFVRSIKGERKLSPKSIIEIYQTVRQVFSLLRNDAGLLCNPFDGVVKPENEPTEREAFTEDELLLIKDNLTDFVRPLFAIAAATGLREGDICCLRWAEIDFDSWRIKRRMNKTRKDVEIPFFEDFAAYLRDLKNAASDSGYVLPEHADMYQHNPTGVSYRVKTFLEKLGITTRKEMPSRGRAVSIKDLHSVRHSFAHYAGLRGIPIATVRSILGHMSEKMTQRYQAHGKLKEKREGLKLMPEFMNLTASAQKQLPASEPERESLLEFIKNADIAIIRSIIKKHCPDVADTCSI